MIPPKDRVTPSDAEIVVLLDQLSKEADTERPPNKKLPPHKKPQTIGELGELVFEWFVEFEDKISARITDIERKVESSELLTKLRKTVDDVMVVQADQSDVSLKQHDVLLKQHDALDRLEALERRLNANGRKI